MNVKELFRRSKGQTRWYEVPYITVSSVKEYFALPKTDREWHGFYMTPFGLPWERLGDKIEGWDAFYDKIQKEYPIQYFFRRWIFSSDNPLYWAFMCHVWWPLRDTKYSIKRWFNPLYPRWRNSLPRHKYCDITEHFVTSNFALIQDFYWEEMIDGVIDWEGDTSHKEFYRQIKAHIDWIEKGLPELEEKFSKELETVSSLSGEYSIKYKEILALEQQKQDKETEILVWFVNNRGFFWT